MSSWSVLTLEIKEDYYGRKEVPVEILMDSGIDELGWFDDYTFYALANGRYQKQRFDKFLEEMNSPKFTGIHIAYVAEVNDTGDEVELDVYRPKQRNYERRMDGYEVVESHEGTRWPEEEREEFQDKIEEIFNLRPVIEHQDSAAPPDMVVER